MKLPKELTTVTRVSKIVALITFIVLVICAFLIGMQYQQLLDMTENELINVQSIAVTQQKPTTIQSPTPTIIIPADWQSYISKKYSYAISVPSNWKSQEDTVEIDHVSFFPKSYLSNTKSKKAPNYIYIQVFETQGHLSLNQYFQSIPFLSSQKQEIITIAGVKAIRIRDLWERAHSDTVYMGNYGRIYRISLQKDAETNDYEDIFDQALSTFRFTK